MKRFLVHVILHDLPHHVERGPIAIFLELDANMVSFGFQQVITDEEGKKWKLPDGVYVIEEETRGIKSDSIPTPGISAGVLRAPKAGRPKNLIGMAA